MVAAMSLTDGGHAIEAKLLKESVPDATIVCSHGVESVVGEDPEHDGDADDDVGSAFGDHSPRTRSGVVLRRRSSKIA